MSTSSSSSTFMDIEAYDKRAMQLYIDVCVEHRIAFSSLSATDQEFIRGVARFKHWALPYGVGMSSSSSSASSMTSVSTLSTASSVSSASSQTAP